MLRALKRGAWITFLLGCSEFVNPNCTDAGCFDGLFIQIAGEVPSAFTVRLPALSPGAWEIACTGVTCAEPIFFQEFTPAEVFIELEVDGVIVFEGSLEPQYESFFPNGPNCDPECLNGRLTITL